jgi:hypothetical protein
MLFFEFFQNVLLDLLKTERGNLDVVIVILAIFRLLEKAKNHIQCANFAHFGQAQFLLLKEEKVATDGSNYFHLQNITAI